jgi:hypothetical protein
MTTAPIPNRGVAGDCHLLLIDRDDLGPGSPPLGLSLEPVTERGADCVCERFSGCRGQCASELIG